MADDSQHVVIDPDPATSPADQQDPSSCPFEGPEKLLEVWFAPTPPHTDGGARTGLRTVDRLVWEEMLDIVKCKVLSVINGRDMDAYLLSESSFFVFPHKLILKTCGTTLNLLGLPRILAIAKEQCGLDTVWQCFYSRKSFMFPERQIGPHREWRDEVEYLDALFDNGAAYTVGKVNGDHWLLYVTSPADNGASSDRAVDSGDEEVHAGDATPYSQPSTSSTETLPITLADQDYTIEILMTKLSAEARRPFFFLEEDLPDRVEDMELSCTQKAAAISTKLGIDALFPAGQTKLDSYAFEPCGYSANALVHPGKDNGVANPEGYYTIHVTPEEGWSYASFECNVPVKPRAEDEDPLLAKDPHRFPDLETLIQRVVNIFQPGHISLTLFVSADPATGSASDPIESAQRVFRQALAPRGYKRTDKINYEFGGYDLAFATFQKK